MSFEIGQGATSPDMTITCSVNGTPKNLVGSTATLRWLKPDGSLVEGVPLTADDLTVGRWIKPTIAGDTDVPGVHRAQVVVTRSGGAIEVYPSKNTYVQWTVNPALAAT